MKTKDFIKKVEDLGLKVEEEERTIALLGSVARVAIVRKDKEYAFDNLWPDFDCLPQPEKKELFDTLIEYASTPVEERKEKKRYLYCLKDIADATTVCHKYGRFLNYCASEDAFTIANKNESDSYKTAFEEDDPLLERVDLNMFDRIKAGENGNVVAE